MRIKICGVTTAADAELAAQLGADAIGLNFYSRSPRCIDMVRAGEIVGALPPFVEPVAVMVAPTGTQMQEVCSAVGLRTVQLHAASPSQLTGAIAAERYSVIVAHGVSDAASLDPLSTVLDSWRQSGVYPAAVLIDSRVEGLHGGTGQTAPWQLLADGNLGLPLILAGGLTPANVAEAIRIVRPYAVDVASGVESAPGITDEEKLRTFIGNAREAAAKFLS